MQKITITKLEVW